MAKKSSASADEKNEAVREVKRGKPVRKDAGAGAKAEAFKAPRRAKAER